MPVTKYAFLFSALKGKLTRSVSREQLVSMLNKKSIYDALVSISGTDVGEFMRDKISPETTLYEAEQLLFRYLWNEVLFIENVGIREVNEVVDKYILRYDLYNIRFILRSLFYEKEISGLIPIGILYKRALLEELSMVKSFKEVVYTLRKAALSDYAEIIDNYLEGLRGKDLNSLRSVESNLYKKYYNVLLKTVSKVRGGTELKRAVRKLIDSHNILVVLRGILSGTPRHLIISSLVEPTMYITLETLVEAAEQNNITQALQILARSPYERILSKVSNTISAGASESLIETMLLQEFLREVHSDLLRSFFSPQPILDYILNKELEISMLRTVLWSLWNNIPKELIEPMLRGVVGEG